MPASMRFPQGEVAGMVDANSARWNLGATRRSRRRASFWLSLSLVIGGFLAVIGGMTTWIKLPRGTIGIQGGAIPGTVHGFELRIGTVALVASAIAVLVGLVWLATAKVMPLAAAVTVLAGVTIIGSAGFVLIATNDVFVDYASVNAANGEMTKQEIETLLPRFFVANDLAASRGVGLFLALAGGLVVLSIGIAAVVLARRSAS
jgi:hypothetical protein